MRKNTNLAIAQDVVCSGRGDIIERPVIRLAHLFILGHSTVLEVGVDAGGRARRRCGERSMLVTVRKGQPRVASNELVQFGTLTP